MHTSDIAKLHGKGIHVNKSILNIIKPLDFSYKLYRLQRPELSISPSSLKKILYIGYTKKKKKTTEYEAGFLTADLTL